MAGTPAYSVNLDPAVSKVPYGAKIDIRGTVNYKEVMKQYSLGPNGAIMTSLNLFATRFDQVIGLMEKRAQEVKCVRVAEWPCRGRVLEPMVAFRGSMRGGAGRCTGQA